MNKAILLTIFLVFAPTTALATSGWGRHDVEVAGFRIVGTEGSSFVYRRHADTRTDPPLFSNVVVAGDGTTVRLKTPPDYAMVNNHLVVRYGHYRLAEESVPNHFVVSLSDGVATKAMDSEEVAALLKITNSQLKWKMPWTAADKFGVTYMFVIVIVSVILIAIVTFLICAVGKWFSGIRNSKEPSADMDA